MPDADASRRALVKYLAASPLLAALATAGCDTDDDNAAEQALERLGTLGEPDQTLVN